MRFPGVQLSAAFVLPTSKQNAESSSSISTTTGWQLNLLPPVVDVSISSSVVVADSLPANSASELTKGIGSWFQQKESDIESNIKSIKEEIAKDLDASDKVQSITADLESKIGAMKSDLSKAKFDIATPKKLQSIAAEMESKVESIKDELSKIKAPSFAFSDEEPLKSEALEARLAEIREVNTKKLQSLKENRVEYPTEPPAKERNNISGTTAKKPTEPPTSEQKTVSHTEKQNFQEEYGRDVAQLRSEISELKSKQVQELLSVEARLKQEYESRFNKALLLDSKVEKLREDWEKEKKEILSNASREREQLQATLKLEKEKYETNLKDLKQESRSLREQVEAANKKLAQLNESTEQAKILEEQAKTLQSANVVLEQKTQSLAAALAAQAEQKNQLEANVKQLEADISSLNERHAQELTQSANAAQNQGKELEQDITSMKETMVTAKNKDSTQKATIASLEKQIQHDKLEYERNSQILRKEYDSAVQRLEGQLDATKTDRAAMQQQYSRIVNQKESEMGEKDTRVAELELSLKQLEAAKSELKTKAEELERRTQQSNNDREAVQEGISRLMDEYEMTKMEYTKAKEEAVDQARQVTIQQAREAFGKVKVQYDKVEQELVGAKAKIKVLERDLETAKTEIEEIKTKQDSTVVDSAMNENVEEAHAYSKENSLTSVEKAKIEENQHMESTDRPTAAEATNEGGLGQQTPPPENKEVTDSSSNRGAESEIRGLNSDLANLEEAKVNVGQASTKSPTDNEEAAKSMEKNAAELEDGTSTAPQRFEGS